MLEAEQVAQFREQGYLVLEGVVDTDRYLDPMVAEYQHLLDQLATQLHDSGSISSTYSELPFGRRLTNIYADTGKVWSRYFDFSLPFKNVTDDVGHFGPAVFNILRCPEILDVAESLIGPEIYSNPVQHVRLKPPERLAPRDPDSGRPLIGATPWHQDAGVVLEEADGTEMLTVWLPVFDATEDNGCLCVVPRNHDQGLRQHCPTGAGNYYLPERNFDADRAVPLPMRRGSALFMDRRTPHCSLPNNSDDVRWSMDLRYNPIGQPTGRPEFPGFVARSRTAPETELRDAEVWKEQWVQTRERMSSHPELVGAFGRWKADAPGCA